MDANNVIQVVSRRLSRKAFLVALIGLCLLGATTTPLHAQVRNGIAIVRPEIDESGKKAYSRLSSFFANNNDKDLSDQFKEMAEGKWFGSGFLVKNADGTIVLVTNRHVVKYVDSVELVFNKADDSMVKITKCPVIYLDPKIDLAIVAVPQEQITNDMLLSVSDSELDDGSDVFSAGLPRTRQRANLAAWKRNHYKP